MVPPVTATSCGLSSVAIARSSVDLPDPDSPTTASVRPARRSKIDPADDLEQALARFGRPGASRVPQLRGSRRPGLAAPRKSRAAHRGAGAATAAMTGDAQCGGSSDRRRAQSVPEKVERQRRDGEEQAGERREIGMAADIRAAFAQHGAPFGKGRLRAEPEEAEAGGGEQGRGEQQGRERQQRAGDVRQHMATGRHAPARRRAKSSLRYRARRGCCA